MVKVVISRHYFAKITLCLLLTFLFHTGSVYPDTDKFEGQEIIYNSGKQIYHCDYVGCIIY